MLPTEVPSHIVFITIDSLTTIVQIVGAALIGIAESKDSRGESTSVSSDQANKILLVGLALQVSFDPFQPRSTVTWIVLTLFCKKCASFLVFLAILSIILVRLRNHTKYPKATADQSALTRVHSSSASEPTVANAEKTGSTFNGQGHTYTKTFLVILYITSLLIFLRTVYRLAETAEGVWGTASSYEWLFGLLEFAPVIAAVLIWLARPLKTEMRRMGMWNVTGAHRNSV